MTTRRIVPQYKTARQRLLAVALLIDSHPSEWNQVEWAEDDEHVTPKDVSYTASCGAFGCAAGWAIAHTPPDQVDPFADWEDGGALAFDIHIHTADALFNGNFGYPAIQKRTRADRMVKALLYLAALTPKDRRSAYAADVIDAIGRGEPQ